MYLYKSICSLSCKSMVAQFSKTLGATSKF
jgi:hypothetical protein